MAAVATIPPLPCKPHQHEPTQVMTHHEAEASLLELLLLLLSDEEDDDSGARPALALLEEPPC